MPDFENIGNWGQIVGNNIPIAPLDPVAAHDEAVEAARRALHRLAERPAGMQAPRFRFAHEPKKPDYDWRRIPAEEFHATLKRLQEGVREILNTEAVLAGRAALSVVHGAPTSGKWQFMTCLPDAEPLVKHFEELGWKDARGEGPRGGPEKGTGINFRGTGFVGDLQLELYNTVLSLEEYTALWDMNEVYLKEDGEIFYTDRGKKAIQKRVCSSGRKKPDVYGIKVQQDFLDYLKKEANVEIKMKGAE